MSDRSTEPCEPELLAPAPALRLKTGLPLTLGGLGVAFLLLTLERRLPFALPLQLASFAVGFVGILELLGGFERADAGELVVARPTLSRHVVEFAVSLATLVTVVRWLVAGALPGPDWLGGGLVTALAVTSLVTSYRVAESVGALRREPGKSLLSHGSLLVLGATLLAYLPMLGSYSLIDPWETHYGEVAREILARDDWFSLWWAQDGWFWSKPIFGFWLQALGFLLFGVRFGAGEMLLGTAGHLPHPEWAARLPIVFCSLLGQALLYAGLRRSWGQRAAIYGGLIWLAVPYWALISHQTMTDLPYAALLAAAFGLFLLGFATPAEQPLVQYELQLGRRTLYLTGRLLTWLALLCAAVPQSLYLASRNLTWVIRRGHFGFVAHADRFLSGSPGNCRLPGNEPCFTAHPVHSQPQPWLMALCWGLALAILLHLQRGERRLQRSLYLGAWICLCYSALAKGIPGLVIGLGTLGAWVFVTRRFRELERLELLSALLAFAALVLPWFVQLTLRHGPGFLERLLIHDMYKRAFVHVHDTNAGDDTSSLYYVWQLGYGLFPASGLALAGWLTTSGGPPESRAQSQSARILLASWILLGFGMFTLTLTKFHHYAMPIAAPLALLAGPFLAEARGNPQVSPKRRLLELLGWLAVTLGLVQAGAMLVWRSRLGPRLWLGQVPAWGNDGFWPGLLLLGLALSLALLLIRTAPSPGRPQSRRKTTVMTVLALVTAVGTLLIGRDLTVSRPSDIAGPARLFHLVCYNYARSWPSQLEFGPLLGGFALAAGLLLLLLAFGARARSQAAFGFALLCWMFAFFQCNLYLPQLAPHYGQQNTMRRYYALRRSKDEPLVAYQLNWKGENFYSGNHVAVFQSTGEPFRKYVDDLRTAGRRTVYFTTEHGRLSSLRSEIGMFQSFAAQTSRRENDKFVLVRVEL